MLHPATHKQFAKVQERFSKATMNELPSGAAIVVITAFPVPAGWTASATDVRFLVPVAYPGPSPDCFWASAGLRLANDQMPRNAQEPNEIPEDGFKGLWFSWHIKDVGQNWNPSRDTLSTYVSIVANRFTKLE